MEFNEAEHDRIAAHAEMIARLTREVDRALQRLSLVEQFGTNQANHADQLNELRAMITDLDGRVSWLEPQE